MKNENELQTLENALDETQKEIKNIQNINNQNKTIINEKTQEIIKPIPIPQEIPNIKEEQITSNEQKNISKNENIKYSLIVVSISLFLTFIIYLIIPKIFNNENSHENNNETVTENNNTEIINDNKIKNGIYQLNDTTIKIYINNNILYYMIKNKEKCHQINITEQCAFSKIYIFNDKNKITSLDNEITIENGNNEIIVTSNSEKLSSGTYKKTKNYTKEEFKKDVVGETKYLNTNINGVFKKDKIEIEIYQYSENQAYVYIKTPELITITTLDIKNGKIDSKTEQTIFGEYIKNEIKIDITENNLTINAYSSDPEYIFNFINGTYTKTKKITETDIFNKFN